MKHILISASVLVSALLCTNIKASPDEEDTDRREVLSVISDFIDGEFLGDVTMRQKYAVTRMESNHNLLSVDDTVVSLIADPLIVVSNYFVEEITLDDNRASAYVHFSVIAKSKGQGLSGREIKKAEAETTKIKYELRKIKSQSKIVDPPKPNVSLEALIEDYINNISVVEQIINAPNVSTQQKQTLKELKGKLSDVYSLQRGRVH